jgi:DNA processing protein
MDFRDYLIALNIVEGLSSLKLQKLLAAYHNPADIFKASSQELKQSVGLDEKTVQNIKSSLCSDSLKTELNLIDKSGIQVVTIKDENYPSILKQITDPPIVLYVKGNYLDTDKVSLAVVGSRRASSYGLEMAYKMSGNLAKQGVTVISGLARGIDTQSHKGALDNKGRTLAVLGSGLLNVYPPENKLLFDEISKRGAVISEFPLKTPPYRYNFPRRNRIISGLSLGVIVIEARQKSGSLITANMALEQGRDVFALPHRAGFFTSSGTNDLIKQGAILVQNVQDVISELNPEIKKYLQYGSKSGTITQGGLKDAIGEQSADIQESLCNLIESAGPQTYEELEVSFKDNREDLIANLTALEVKGMIVKTSDGRFKKSNLGE